MLVETDVCFYRKDGNSFVYRASTKYRNLGLQTMILIIIDSTTGYFLNQPINELDYLVTEMAITKSQCFQIDYIVQQRSNYPKRFQ